jgi:hypothetical protein
MSKITAKSELAKRLALKERKLSGLPNRDTARLMIKALNDAAMKGGTGIKVGSEYKQDDLWVVTVKHNHGPKAGQTLTLKR